MAMMMTGRVLLVCALCVLWCLSGFGAARDNRCGEGGGDVFTHAKKDGDDRVRLKADCGLLSTRMGLINAVAAGDDGEDGSNNAVLEKTEKSLHSSVLAGPGDIAAPGAKGVEGAAGAGLPPSPSGPGGSGTGGEQRQSEQLDTKGKGEGGKRDEKGGKAAESQQQRPDQSSSSGSDGPQGGKELALKEKSESTEPSVDTPTQEDEVETEETNVSEKEEPGGDEGKNNNVALTVTSESQAKLKKTQTATPPTTQVNERSRTEDLGYPQQPKGVQSDIESKYNSQTEDGVSIAANQQNEPSDDHGKSGIPSPTANGGAANNETDNSTEDGISNSDPAADATGTREGKQNENKDANPKKTPVTAAAMKTTTATTGDSDGSTAVSHTTSHLLLLLVVFACAAAAAVVAA
ncbi:Mucin-associated surface protein (MASP) [Trypanosoma cruzi]|uniref:Mucin-associated surface protein (MASP), putative n=2 Tax=Trypanosoma cruzi TaxID=5693 RepID=Q4D036_TRYCC|nr:mucin-associated surface protein (MASP), putative [Trypanosoma cruzi]EAN85885.1 mucin-associated surface protein (MASP), putative [Trypanosoma cruzi]PWV20616.1 Mucin-associated surface protein (MASP) [Trypanosoma cruzi]RNC39649.1 mucin-associated surface protein (MASP) [Trypanosoma cruzi]|eukprot:XP_807736.1 mucin-associated surface protein (MASP) [Trypanosoma cruzi strain CL Brener]